jgi:hypothetical protein
MKGVLDTAEISVPSDVADVPDFLRKGSPEAGLRQRRIRDTTEHALPQGEAAAEKSRHATFALP